MISGKNIKGLNKPNVIDINIDPELVPSKIEDNIRETLYTTSDQWDLYLSQATPANKIKKANNYGLELLYDKSNNIFESKNPLFDKYGNTRLYSNCKNNKNYCEAVDSVPRYKSYTNLVNNTGVYMGICRPEYGKSSLLNNPVIAHIYNILKNIIPRGDNMYEFNPLSRLSCDEFWEIVVVLVLLFIIFIVVVVILVYNQFFLTLLILIIIIISIFITSFLTLDQ